MDLENPNPNYTPSQSQSNYFSNPSLVISIETKLQQLQTENKKLSQLLSNYKEVNKQLDEKHSIQQQDLDKANNQLIQKKQLLHEARNQITETKQIIEELNQANQELIIQNTKLLKKYNKIKSNSENVFALEMQLKSVKKEKNNYLKQYQEVNSEFQEIMTELDEADKKVQYFKLQFDQREAQNEQTISIQQKENYQLKQENKILLEDNNDLKSQLQIMEAKIVQLEEIQVQIIDSGNYLEVLKKENKKKEKEYKDKLSRYKEKFKFLKESEFKDISEQYQEQIQDQAYEFQRQKTKLEIQIQRLTEENAQLKSLHHSQEIQPKEELFLQNELKQKLGNYQQLCEKNMKMILLIASENERLHLLIEKQNQIIQKMRYKLDQQQIVNQEPQNQSINGNSKLLSSEKKKRNIFL